jgi:predicted membrane protein
MTKRGQVILGSALLLLGIFALVGVVFQIDWGLLCWPALLILLGVWLLFRPQFETAGTHILLLGDVRRNGIWQVTKETYWIGIGDVRLDFSQAEVPVGETVIQINGLIGALRVTAPPGFALAISASGLIINSTIFENHADHFLTPVEECTPGYETAERRVRLDSVRFINDLKIRQE